LKNCSNCGATKAITEFYKTGAICKSCGSIRNKAYNLANAERNQARRDLPENKAIKRVYQRERYLRDRGTILEQYQSQKEVLKVRRGEMSPELIIRRRLRTSLYRTSGRKGWVTPIKNLDQMIGISYSELWEYLKGTWFDTYLYELSDELFEIDHIIPCMVALSVEELAWIYHYTNLQLLSPKDNQLKGHRIQGKN